MDITTRENLLYEVNENCDQLEARDLRHSVMIKGQTMPKALSIVNHLSQERRRENHILSNELNIGEG